MIVFSSPVVTTILAHFLVGEEIGIIFILIAIFTLCGVGCVTKPPIFTGAKEFDTGSLVCILKLNAIIYSYVCRYKV